MLTRESMYSYDGTTNCVQHPPKWLLLCLIGSDRCDEQEERRDIHTPISWHILCALRKSSDNQHENNWYRIFHVFCSYDVQWTLEATNEKCRRWWRHTKNKCTGWLALRSPLFSFYLSPLPENAFNEITRAQLEILMCMRPSALSNPINHIIQIQNYYIYIYLARWAAYDSVCLWCAHKLCGKRKRLNANEIWW